MFDTDIHRHSDITDKLKAIKKHAKRCLDTIVKLTSLNNKYAGAMQARDEELCQYRIDLDAKDRLVKTCKQSLDHHQKAIVKLRKDMSAKLAAVETKLVDSNEIVEKLTAKLRDYEVNNDTKRRLRFDGKMETDKVHRISLSSLGSTAGLALSAISNRQRTTNAMLTHSDVQGGPSDLFANVCGDAFVTFKQCTTLDLVNPLDLE